MPVVTPARLPLQDTGKDPVTGAETSVDELLAVKNNTVSYGHGSDAEANADYARTCYKSLSAVFAEPQATAITSNQYTWDPRAFA